MCEEQRHLGVGQSLRYSSVPLMIPRDLKVRTAQRERASSVDGVVSDACRANIPEGLKRLTDETTRTSGECLGQSSLEPCNSHLGREGGREKRERFSGGDAAHDGLGAGRRRRQM